LRKGAECYLSSEVVSSTVSLVIVGQTVEAASGCGVASGRAAAAVRSFARCWTTDLRHRQIRVNVISPGYTETPIFNKAGLTQARVDELKMSFAAAVPLGRMGRPDEVAKAALFLASDDSSYVAGIELVVDGGVAQV